MNVVIIGAGNVGTHFAKALKLSGATILQIVSQTMKSAVELASEVGCAFSTDFQNINNDADIYILCVSDSAIIPVLRQLHVGNKLIVHTSGSLGINVFYDYAENYGCIYPLQTFSKFKDLNYSEIPIFIEANTEENQQKLMEFIKIITPHVQVLTSQQRCVLHLSAVMVNNFSNHLCTLAEILLKEHQLQFDTIKPLLKETYEKIIKYSPYIAQTGPAVRNDELIMQKHRDILAKDENMLNIYNAMSKSITDLYNNEK